MRTQFVDRQKQDLPDLEIIRIGAVRQQVSIQSSKSNQSSESCF